MKGQLVHAFNIHLNIYNCVKNEKTCMFQFRVNLTIPNKSF